jgi:hypothetical protein
MPGYLELKLRAYYSVYSKIVMVLREITAAHCVDSA